ncbi:hypothetical protein CHELA1G11_12995 [Hyphomicrobiales bacterium]|nr:hypothetical protein CHELA1G2_11315 [Hyphomicrobiales bacterium]CAH1668571.1 hypothetical protein CHELA1G11_12995 [Hyphomicrobiales bacterium]
MPRELWIEIYDESLPVTAFARAKAAFAEDERGGWSNIDLIEWICLGQYTVTGAAAFDSKDADEPIVSDKFRVPLKASYGEYFRFSPGNFRIEEGL